VFYAANSLTGEQLSSSAPVGQLVCDFPNLLLLPGRYSLTFNIEMNGTLVDSVRHATYFDVFEDDVFGTGKLPQGTYGRLMVAQRWSNGDVSA